jgi:hypothetical protein
MDSAQNCDSYIAFVLQFCYETTLSNIHCAYNYSHFSWRRIVTQNKMGNICQLTRNVKFLEPIIRFIAESLAVFYIAGRKVQYEPR